MSFRIFGVSLVWTIVLFVILLGIYSPSMNLGSSFSIRFSMQYFLGFGLLSFSICSSLKKQMKKDYYRRNAFQISAIICAIMLILVEALAMGIYPGRSIQFFWMFFGLLGIATGLGAFRLLYDACC